jgi:hypothetical protein
MELNRFSDMSLAEFDSFKGYKPSLKTEIEEVESEIEVEILNAPASVDWRASGAVTPI